MPVTATSHGSTSVSPSSKPFFFWKPHAPGGFLSQWYPSPFTLNGETYATAEMWMMVEKARLFSDEAIASQMLATTDPKEHRELGRLVEGFSEKVWDEHKLDIVIQGNVHKFTIGEKAGEFKKWLEETGERELVEASPFDKIWGVGFEEKNAERNRGRWGQNLLGKALMEVRRRVREDER